MGAGRLRATEMARAAQVENMSMLIACHDCDLLHRMVEIPAGAAARCSRCGSVLRRHSRREMDHTLAWTCTAVILYLLANLFPIITLDVQGQETSTTLLGTVGALIGQEMHAVAALVLVTAFLAPGLSLAALLYLLVPLHRGRLAPGFPTLMRLLQKVSPWAMLEVFVLGILVSAVKLSHIAAVVPGVGMWSFGALMVAVVAAAASYDTHSIWERVAAIPAHQRTVRAE
jgi:paraquat-inducible protein A